uniref:S100 calcium binding protein A13 n=2 Tax=Falco TaxID=8952 RepID=A0A8C4UB46_FALTI
MLEPRGMLQPNGCRSKPLLSSCIPPLCPVVPSCSRPTHPHGSSTQAVPRRPGQVHTSRAERCIWSAGRVGREKRRTFPCPGGVCASVRLQQEIQHRGKGQSAALSPPAAQGIKPPGGPQPADPCRRRGGSSPCSPGPLPCPGIMATGELTELEMAIEKIVTIFFTYAGKEGKKGTLTVNEFKELVQLQLPNLMKDVPSLEEKMSELDVNNDEELKFGEYWRLIGELAKAMRREKAGKK